MVEPAAGQLRLLWQCDVVALHHVDGRRMGSDHVRDHGCDGARPSARAQRLLGLGHLFDPLAVCRLLLCTQPLRRRRRGPVQSNPEGGGRLGDDDRGAAAVGRHDEECRADEGDSCCEAARRLLPPACLPPRDVEPLRWLHYQRHRRQRGGHGNGLLGHRTEREQLRPLHSVVTRLWVRLLHGGNTQDLCARLRGLLWRRLVPLRLFPRRHHAARRVCERASRQGAADSAVAAEGAPCASHPAYPAVAQGRQGGAQSDHDARLLVPVTHQRRLDPPAPHLHVRRARHQRVHVGRTPGEHHARTQLRVARQRDAAARAVPDGRQLEHDHA